MTGCRRYSSRAIARAVSDTSSRIDAAAELCEEAREPSGARPEIENGRAGRQLQSLHQDGHVDEQRRRLVSLAERLGELMIPVRDRGEVLLGRLIELLDRGLLDQLGDLDRRGDIVRRVRRRSLGRLLQIQQRGLEPLVRLEHDVHGLDASRLKHVEHARQVVGVAYRTKGSAAGRPTRHVDERVRARHRASHPSQRLHRSPPPCS